MTRFKPKSLAALALLPLLLLGACAAGNAEADTQGTEQSQNNEQARSGEFFEINGATARERIRSTENAEAIALLPEEITERGTFRVAVIAGSAPLGFLDLDDATPIGSESDFAQLVADGLGLELELEVKAWADWPLAVQSGEVDAVISNVTVTEERKELYDFASYRDDVLGWQVAGNNEEITEISEHQDIAGLTIAVGSGTNQEKILLEWDRLNQEAGLEPIKVEYFESAADYLLALQSGRIDAYFGPNVTAAYQVLTEPGAYKVVGTVSGGWPLSANIAVGTAKDNGLIEAIHASLGHAFENGTYENVLERWGLEDEKIAKTEINPPGLPKTE